MAEKVGEVYYSVTLDTAKLVEGQRNVDRAVSTSVQSLDGLEAKLTQVAQAVSAYAAALFVVRQSDAYTKLTAQLKLATDSTRELSIAQAAVKQIAQEAQTEITGVGLLYARITTATKELGTSQKTVGDITRVVALALKVSGATAEESASATLQLSQAFASGVLRGEEFNAVNEAAPRLMRALADGIGVPVGALRAMAEQGKLTSEVLANSLPKALGDLEQEARQVQTISGAFQQLRNEVLLFIGEQTTAGGAAKLVAGSIATLAANIDTLAAAAVGFVTAKLAKTLLDVSINAAQSAKATLDSALAHQAARAAAIEEAAEKVKGIAATQAGIIGAREEMTAKLASANATLQAAMAQAQAARSAGALSFAIASLREAEVMATAATRARSAALAELAILGQQQVKVTAAMSAAQTAQTAALSASGTAATFASRALGLLGGPIGLVTTLLGVGATAWALWGSAAKDSEAKASSSVEQSTEEIVANLEKQILKLRERNSLASAGLAGIAKQESAAADKLGKLQGQINDLMAGKGVDGGAPLPEAARVALLQQLLGQYGEIAGKVREVSELQEKLNATGQSSKLTEWMAKYASNAERARTEIEAAKKELGAAFTPELEQRIRQKFMPDKKSSSTFDAQGYLDALRQANMQGLALIDERTAQELEKNRKLLDEKKISTEQYTQAVAEIELKAQADRNKLYAQDRDVALAAAEAKRQQIEEQSRLAAEAAKATAEEFQKNDPQKLIDKTLGKGEDPVSKLLAENDAKLQAVADYEAQRLLTEEQASALRVALMQQEAEQLAAIEQQRQQQQAMVLSAQLQNYGSLFAGIADLTKTFAGEQSGAYRAMFAVSKAFAIADAVVKIQQGIANALSLPWPANLAAAASTASAAVGIVSTIQGANFGGGRRYGGPTEAGKLYQVNESGKPEMYTASNGAQYMMPTKNGKVTAADKVGGGAAPTIIIQNMGTPQQVQSQSYDSQSNTLKLVIADLVDQFSNNSGPVYNAAVASTNMRGRL